MKKQLMCLLICAAILFPVGAQNNPENAGSIQNGRLILNIDLSWNEQQKIRLSGLFMLDSTMLHAIFEGNTDFINDSTDWVAVFGKNGFLELSKTIGGSPDEHLDKIILSDLPSQRMAPPPPTPFATDGINELKADHVFSYTDGIACFFLPSRQKAKSVYLSGSFNHWSTMQLPMNQTDSGWIACLTLTPGKHLYKYIVDGRWMQDPNNKLRERDGQRGYNSVVYAYNYVFSLEGHTNARRVFLAGSFNNWRPGELLMQRSDKGWELPLFIREGTHSYKFIVDGNWITDPANPDIKEDGAGNLNSIISIGDTMSFRLSGHTDAERVILTGSFNAWNTGELPMEKHDSGWRLPHVLGAGNYEYKFIVDGQWITDPGNPFTTGEGDFTNSFLAFKPNHVFELNDYPDAETVIVTGSFNGWNHNEYHMTLRDHRWVFPVYLIPGRHTYKFIVDGQWILDPGNPLWEENEFGTGNSVLWLN